MKKKILSLALVVALIAIMVGGSLAYFTDNDQVTNTFTIGSVKIEIYENNKATDDETVKFEEPLVPVVDMMNPSTDDGYIEKAIKVYNEGLNDAYIRTHVAIPTVLKEYLLLNPNLSEVGWKQVAITEAQKDGVDYTVYTYDYLEAVKPDTYTPDLLRGVYLASYVDLEEASNGDLYFVIRNKHGEITDRSGYLAHAKNADGTYTCKGVNILVASQAIQAQGFKNGATDALNTGFGANTNPWA